jgi:hypothetical protein
MNLKDLTDDFYSVIDVEGKVWHWSRGQPWVAIPKSVYYRDRVAELKDTHEVRQRVRQRVFNAEPDKWTGNIWNVPTNIVDQTITDQVDEEFKAIPDNSVKITVFTECKSDAGPSRIAFWVSEAEFKVS